MERGKIVTTDAVISSLIGHCERHLDRGEVDLAECTFNNAVYLAMAFIASDEVGHKLLTVEKRLPGKHIALEYFRHRLLVKGEEEKQLEGDRGARGAHTLAMLTIERVSHRNWKPFDPLLPPCS